MPTERPSLADILAPLSASFRRIADAQRRSVAECSNLAARQGAGGPPRRYLSDAGFLINLQFSYLEFAPSSATYDDTGAPRTLNRLRFLGYGLTDDFGEFVQEDPSVQIIHSANAARGSGVRDYGPNNRYVIACTSYGPGPYDPYKIRAFCRTQPSGPVAIVDGPHFLITREGAIIVVGSADATAACSTAEDSNNGDVLFVGVESALAISQADYARQAWDKAFELPFTPAQLVTMAVLIQKLKTAMPNLANAAFSNDITSPLSYTLLGVPSTYEPAWRKNLQPEVPSIDRRSGTTPFDYSGSTGPALVTLSGQQGSYDISRNVWIPTPQAPPTAQEETRIVINQASTLGASSPLLGVYAEAAGGARAQQMRDQSRPEVFYSRRRVSHQTAQNTEQQEQTAQATGTIEEVLRAEVQNYAPHVYDFVTGYWGDGGSF